MFRFLKQKISWPMILFFLTILIVAVYSLTSGGETPYNYFIRLADAFLHGKYYLTESPSWLNELVPIANNKFAVIYPPAPAIVAIPFVLIFGINFQQQILSQLMGALAAFIWGLVAYKKSGSKSISLWIFLLSALGNVVWHLSSSGSVWYLGQVSAYLFLTLTIYESISNKRVFFLILYFGLACLSRLQVVLALPLIFYLNFSHFKNIKRLVGFFLGMTSFAIFYSIYNCFRFGSFIETGYGLIPGVLDEPWYKFGIFNIRYIPDNLRVAFLSLPIFMKSVPYIIPSWGGLSIIITSPVFVYSFFANIKKHEVQLSWLSLILIALVVMSHGTTGFAQFGYRFAVDFYPLILFLIIDVVAKQKLKWHHYTLLSISILVNTWGVLFINKFGFVGW